MTPRRGDETREALMEAALQVFVRRGFARATTREIAQTAGVAEGTIYRHFEDKYALFLAVFHSLLGEIGGQLLRFRERAGQETLRNNLAYLFELVGAMQERLAALMGSMWSDPELARQVRERTLELSPMGFTPPSPVGMVAEYVRAEQALGRIRGDVDAEQAASVVVSIPLAAGMERALSAQQLSEAPGFPVPEPFPLPGEGALDILVRGLEPAG